MTSMKNTILFLLLLIAIGCQSQSSDLLLEKELVTDLSNEPIYQRLTEKEDGIIKWKKEFEFMDSIEFYSISYLSDGLKINGFLTQPKKEGKYPAIIFNRGGNRNFGALDINSTIYLTARLAQAGYVVIASNYRGGGGSEGMEEFGGKEINDVIILPEVLKEIKKADTEKIGMYGWSRGGMMTYLALTKMDNIKAAAVGGAVSDNFATIEDRPDMETYVLAELIPNYEINKEAELIKRSAIKWVDQFPKDVPLLIMHGNSDWRVKPEQSIKLALELEKHRVPYRLIIYEGGDHGISEHKKEKNDEVIKWFDKYLKNNAPLPNMEYHGR